MAHQFVVQVEKALDQQEIALGAFLDIERAFNNTCYDTMCDALVRHGSEYTIMQWIKATWLLRALMKFLRGSQYPGVALREVLSLHLWCLVVNDVLTRLSRGGAFIQGYADDMSSRGG